MTTTKANVLLVEDDPLHAQIIEEMIASEEGGYCLEVLDRLSAARESLDRGLPDLILLDLELPDSQGIQTFQALHAAYPDIPIVILTATGNDELATRALQGGAQDYLVKWQLNGHLLQRAIRYAIERKRAELSQQQERRAVRWLARALPYIVFLDRVGDHQLTFCNERAEALFPPKAVLKGRSRLLAALHAEDREAFFSCIERVSKVAPDVGVSVDLRFGSDADGWRWLDCHAIVYHRDAAGLPSEVLWTAQDITERRTDDLRLRESEERLRLALTAARMGAWEWNTAADRLIGDEYVNRLIDFTNAGVEALLSKVHPDDQSLVREEVGHIVRTQEPRDLEFRLYDPAGQERWVSASIGVRSAKLGEPLRVIGVLQDVTERKQSEEYYRLLSSAVRNSQDGILITTAQLDPPGPQIVFVNPAFCRMSGYDYEELIGATPRLLQGERTNRDLLDQMRAHLMQGESFSAETINYRKDGQEYTVEWQVSPVRGPSGEITHFISIQRNVSARRRNEERLRQQATLLDGAQDAIIIRDLDEGIVYWNRGAERLYGWSAEEVRGRSLKEFLHREIPREYEKARQTLMAQGKWMGELRQQTREGRELIVECRWTLIYGANKKPKSILVINTDVTEKKRLEAMALRAQRLESIGALASGIAHDLNNVLAPILMALHTLQQRFTDESSQRWLSLIHKSAERGRDLINQVLSFAKGVEGERAPLRISHLIRDIENILKETLPRNIELQVIVPDGLWTVIGDTTQIHQVLMNLCLNARDAMPDGGRLLIKARNRYLVEEEERLVTNPKQKQYVRITIADTGIGIPPEIIDRVFDPFFTTKEKGQGSGLGLSMVQGIVRGHGGFVNVLSQVGEGTEFKIYLPAQELPVLDPETPPEAELPVGNGELILVVDDEADIREVTSRTLEGHGYRVLVARDGREAVNIYREHMDEIQLVLTDMVMPNLDGPGAIRELKQLNPRVRVVATSGVKTTGKLAEATQEGAKTFLPKPYTADKLLAVIAETLDEELLISS